MTLLHDGTDVRIADDGRVWVLVPAGVLGAAARWKRVPLDMIELDAASPGEVTTPFGKHPLGDLGIDVYDVSRVLGVAVRGSGKIP